ncbi:MAG: thioredoxin domain-containing protein [Thermoplasmata archaeon]
MDRIGPEAFEGDRLLRQGTWAIAFLADWCPFCRSFAPEFEALAVSQDFQIAVADLADEDSPLWERFDVAVVPTIIAFRDGRSIFRRDGHLGEGLSTADLAALTQALGPT